MIWGGGGMQKVSYPHLYHQKFWENFCLGSDHVVATLGRKVASLCKVLTAVGQNPQTCVFQGKMAILKQSKSTF